MQIDLANALVCKAYFVYYVLFIISPQARPPLLSEGPGEASPFGGAGGEVSSPPLGGVGGGQKNFTIL